jgi:hypothetical protein
VNCKKVGSYPAFLRVALTNMGTFRTVVYPVRLRVSALGERLSPFFGDGETPDAVIARLAARWPGYGLRARVAVGQKIQTRQKRQRGSARVPTTGRTGMTENGPGKERPSLTLGGFSAAVDLFSRSRVPKKGSAPTAVRGPEAQRVHAKCGGRFSGLISFFDGITLKLRCLSSISHE